MTGSLIARIIFQPLEETLHLHHSRTPSPSLLAYSLHISLYLPLITMSLGPSLGPLVIPHLLPPAIASPTPRQPYRHI